jgi:hypothetical protein
MKVSSNVISNLTAWIRPLNGCGREGPTKLAVYQGRPAGYFGALGAVSLLSPAIGIGANGSLIVMATYAHQYQTIGIVKAYEEIIEFIAAGTTPDSVVSFRPSAATKTRVRELIQREKTTGLSIEDKSELDHMQLEHLTRLAKARANHRS